jgi:hypothetical protein
MGRPIRDKVWNLTTQAGLWPVPLPGTSQDDPSDGHRGSVTRPGSLEPGGTDEPPDWPPEQNHKPAIVIGDALYPVLIADAFKAGHVTEAEAEHRLDLHRLVEGATP